MIHAPRIGVPARVREGLWKPTRQPRDLPVDVALSPDPSDVLYNPRPEPLSLVILSFKHCVMNDLGQYKGSDTGTNGRELRLLLKFAKYYIIAKPNQGFGQIWERLLINRESQFILPRLLHP